MSDENKDPKVKLYCDVMPQAQPPPAPAAAQEPAKKTSPLTPLMATTGPIMAKTRSFIANLGVFKKINWKIIGIVAAVALIGLGGWFGYEKWSQSKTPVAPVTQPPSQSTLSEEWLQKYFHSDTCTDPSMCGPDADP